ncbi:keratin, type I cytoskeletal 9-like [Topomyia yanbarensis]|uniref:keratin, type I cytoskeletal 9-like n=1 Tax=Topomyia yanbarensis TaxID=2498891 RepID=UPI00273BB462|nr:keratin, type I cytoskeletal 9-like [Topomyia yanbarensis]
MGYPKLIGLIAIIGIANAMPNGFQSSSYPQNQVNAWGQACRNFQQFQLQTQAAQSQYFSHNFPHIGLPPLPFMDVCSQIPGGGGGGGFTHSGAGASAGASGFTTANRFGDSNGIHGISVSTGTFPGSQSGFETNNRFGGSDGGSFQGVSVSSGSLPGGQSGTTVTHFGPGGGTVSHYPNGGNFATANRFGGGNGGSGSHGGGSYGGASVSTFGSSSGAGNSGFATASRFGGSDGGAAGFNSGFNPFGGGSFATASRFGADGTNVYTAQGPHGAGISVSSVNDGSGKVHTQVHKQQY